MKNEVKKMFKFFKHTPPIVRSAALFVLAALLVIAVGFVYYRDVQAPTLSVSSGDGAANGGSELQDSEDPSETNIRVRIPGENAEISLPLVVKGDARVFENTVNFRLLDESGALLVEHFATADSPDIGQFGAFESTVSYPKPKGTKGTLEVFWYSPADGTEEDKVIIPVKFAAVDTSMVKVFFGNTKEDPQMTDCSFVHAVERRIVRTTAVARAALDELLRGPFASEQKDGYFTSLNPDSGLKSVTVQNGIAYAEFDERLDKAVGGSCRVSAIRAQITQTLKQFSTVKSVVISINGRTEDILQP